MLQDYPPKILEPQQDLYFGEVYIGWKFVKDGVGYGDWVYVDGNTPEAVERAKSFATKEAEETYKMVSE